MLIVKFSACMMANKGSPITVPALDRVVAELAREEGWTGVRYELKPGSNIGDNYVGVIYKVTITGEKQGKKVTKSLICKAEPESKERREAFRTAEFFNTEAILYNDVLPAYKKLQDKRGLPPSKHFAAFPSRCYHAGSPLILEDMNVAGFVMRNRVEALDVAHCRLVVQQLGHLHALSFALRDQDPDEFHRLTTQLQENLFLRDESREEMLAHCETFTNKAIQNFKTRTKMAETKVVRYERLLQDFKQNNLTYMIEAVSGQNAEPYAVITHGDCWTNNLLFKYTEGKCAPEQLCFLDFQISRFASPVTDLAYFFFACTDKKMRDQHYDQLMSDYHRSFSENLELLGCDPEKLFPFQALQDQLHKFGRFGLGMAILVLPLFTCDPKNAPDMDEAVGRVLDMTNFAEELCWVRMNEVIEDMVERGYLGA